MHFEQSTADEAVHDIAGRLGKELSEGKRVLWLVSGGSNIALEVKIMSLLRDSCSEVLSQLTILPMDERYGVSGHMDSNTEALRAAGFQPGQAIWHDVLAYDLPLEETIEHYNDLATDALAEASVVIGQFGLGTDGHVAGILPGSPACEEDYATVVGYEWSDYTRLTLSPRALAEVSVAFVPAFGEAKKLALERLQKGNEPLARLPAMLLQEIPEVYVYNDLIDV